MDDVDDSRGTRVPHVCQACRVRHARCAWDPDQERCRQCLSNDLECIPQSVFRFRYDPKAKSLAAPDARSRYTWTVPGAALTFHDETQELRRSYASDTIPAALYESYEDTHPDITTSPDAFSRTSAVLTPNGPPASESYATSPETTAEAALRCYTAVSSFTASEAVLVRNYVSRMALWTDATDPTRTFEHEVPRRALTDPLLRHAICAFSAKHFHRNNENSDCQAEALGHQTQCLELLIPALSSGQSIDESTLAAVAILRQCEEMDELDNGFHLEGISRILATVPHFVAAGGLGEAAAWLCLREEIYVSLTTQSRINIGLEDFSNAAALRPGDDYSWANRMILILAQLLNRTFEHPTTEEDIAISQADLISWNRLKPPSYQPIHFESNSHQTVRSFPTIWMLAPHHAVGLQYYHIAQIILAMMKQAKAIHKPYFDMFANRAKERLVARHLRYIVGLAVSNDTAENTWFTARHCLSVWGGFLRKSGDQEAAIRFLENMSNRTGWNTSRLVETLRVQWHADSESE